MIIVAFISERYHWRKECTAIFEEYLSIEILELLLKVI